MRIYDKINKKAKNGGMAVKLKAYAKINLMLDVTGVKKNGYHKLYTVMQSVSLCDIIDVEKLVGEDILIECTKPGVPTDSSNIVYKCAEAFYRAAGISKNRGLKIKIEKHIPSEAGMGGGSADGAAVLKALNAFYGDLFSERRLAEIGATVGADIPFTVIGGTALCLDIGSVVAPLRDITDCYFVIVRPESGSKTGSAYKAIDSDPSLRHPKGEPQVEAILEGDTKEALRFCANIFEQVIEVPKRVDIKSVMNSCGAAASCMTGSGSAVFGAFLNKADAKKCENALKEEYENVFFCEPKATGVEICD